MNQPINQTVNQLVKQSINSLFVCIIRMIRLGKNSQILTNFKIFMNVQNGYE